LERVAMACLVSVP